MLLAAAAATTSFDWHRITSAQYHGIPVIGIAVVIVIALLALKAVFRIARSLLVIGVLVAALIFFAPALLGKKGAAALDQTTGAFTNCAGQLQNATLAKLLHCSRTAATPAERAAAHSVYLKARRAALARAKAAAAAKASK